jgi:hypothetical protein
MGFVREETAKEEKSIVFFLEAARAFPREQGNVASQNTSFFFSLKRAKLYRKKNHYGAKEKNIYVLADASNY